MASQIDSRAVAAKCGHPTLAMVIITLCRLEFGVLTRLSMSQIAIANSNKESHDSGTHGYVGPGNM